MGMFELIGLGYDSYKNAQEWSEHGVKCVKEKEKVLKKRQKETEQKVCDLDNMKLGIWQSFSEFVDLFESISNKPAHLEGSYTKENIDISKEDLEGLRLNASVAGEILIGTAEGAVKGAAVGGLAAGTAVVVGAVKTMGLTWVGIEGGFTVATQLAQTGAMLKTTLFTPFSAFVIPAAIVTAVSLYNSTIKSIDKAYDIYFQSLSICRKYGEALDRLYKIEMFCEEFQGEIEHTNKMFQFRMGCLKKIAEARNNNYREFSDEEKYVLESTILLLKYLKAIIAEPIFKTKDEGTTKEKPADPYFNEYGVRETLETARVQRTDLIEQEKTIFEKNSANQYKLPEGYVYKITKSGKKKVIDTEKDGDFVAKEMVYSCKKMHVKLTEPLTIEGRAYFEDCVIEAAADRMYALQVSEGYCVFKNCEFIITTMPKWCVLHVYGGAMRFDHCKFTNWEIPQGIFQQEGTAEVPRCFMASLSDYKIKSYIYMDHCVSENGKGRLLCVEEHAIAELKECKIKNHIGTFASSNGCESAENAGIRMTKCRFDGCTPRDKEAYLMRFENSQITADKCDFKNSTEGYLWDSASETLFSGCSFLDLKPDNKKCKEKYVISFGYNAVVADCKFSNLENANIFIGSHDGTKSISTCKMENCVFEKVKGEIFVQQGHILSSKFIDCVGYVSTGGSIARDITMVNCYNKDREQNNYITRGTNLSYSYTESTQKKKERENIETLVRNLETVSEDEASEIIKEICAQIDGKNGISLINAVLKLYYPQKRKELEGLLYPIAKNYVRRCDGNAHMNLFSWDNDLTIVENGDIPLAIGEEYDDFKWVFTEKKVILIEKGEKKEWELKEINSFLFERVTSAEVMGFAFSTPRLYVVLSTGEKELVEDPVSSWAMEKHIQGVNEVIGVLKDTKKREVHLEKVKKQQEQERLKTQQRKAETNLLQAIVQDSDKASVTELEEMIRKVEETSVQMVDKNPYIKDLKAKKTEKKEKEKQRRAELLQMELGNLKSIVKGSETASVEELEAMLAKINELTVQVASKSSFTKDLKQKIKERKEENATRELYKKEAKELCLNLEELSVEETQERLKIFDEKFTDQRFTHLITEEKNIVKKALLKKKQEAVEKETIEKTRKMCADVEILSAYEIKKLLERLHATFGSNKKYIKEELASVKAALLEKEEQEILSWFPEDTNTLGIVEYDTYITRFDSGNYQPELRDKFILPLARKRNSLIAKKADEIGKFIKSKASGRIKEDCLEFISYEGFMRNLQSQTGAGADTLVCRIGKGAMLEIYTEKFVNEELSLRWNEIAYFEAKKKLFGSSLLCHRKNGVSKELSVGVSSEQFVSTSYVLNSLHDFVKSMKQAVSGNEQKKPVQTETPIVKEIAATPMEATQKPAESAASKVTNCEEEYNELRPFVEPMMRNLEAHATRVKDEFTVCKVMRWDGDATVIKGEKAPILAVLRDATCSPMLMGEMAINMGTLPLGTLPDYFYMVNREKFILYIKGQKNQWRISDIRRLEFKEGFLTSNLMVYTGNGLETKFKIDGSFRKHIAGLNEIFALIKVKHLEKPVISTSVPPQANVTPKSVEMPQPDIAPQAEAPQPVSASVAPAEQSVAEFKFCTECGQQIKATAKFCKFCGTRVEEIE